ncbi:MAG: hypothetical protein QNL88_08415, partial [Acidobacteriota bacterium]|nr:hypothetical protein [Acidobacteriota bacterium]
MTGIRLTRVIFAALAAGSALLAGAAFPPPSCRLSPSRAGIAAASPIAIAAIGFAADLFITPPSDKVSSPP